MNDTQVINSIINSQNKDCTLSPEKEVVFDLSDSDSDSDVCRNIPSRPLSSKFTPEPKKKKSSNRHRTSVFDKSNSSAKLSLGKSTDLNGSVNYKHCNDSKKQKLSTSHTNDDPLEGSSWMFNGSQNRSSDSGNLSSSSESPENVRCKGTRTSLNQLSSFTFRPPPLANASDDTQFFSSDSPKKDEISKPKSTENSPEEMTMNFARFVTKHRGHSAVEEVEDFDEMDDPTIMLNIRQQTQKTRFNVDDLRLPTIGSPVVVEPPVEPEITSTINIVAINGVHREPVYDLPNLSLPRMSDFVIPPESSHVESTPISEKKVQRKRKKKSVTEVIEVEQAVSKPAKKKGKHKVARQDKDPSSAKVVLEKLPVQETKFSEESGRSGYFFYLNFI